nr:MAG TPA: hypothetical protein [Caudoviricetes sp.]
MPKRWVDADWCRGCFGCGTFLFPSVSFPYRCIVIITKQATNRKEPP